jgi:cytidylate kinase
VGGIRNIPAGESSIAASAAAAAATAFLATGNPYGALAGALVGAGVALMDDDTSGTLHAQMYFDSNDNLVYKVVA